MEEGATNWLRVKKNVTEELTFRLVLSCVMRYLLQKKEASLKT